MTRKCKVCDRVSDGTCPECRLALDYINAAHARERECESRQFDRPAGWDDRLESLSRRAAAGLPLFGG